MENGRRRWIRASLLVGVALAGLWLLYDIKMRVRLVDAERAPAASSLKLVDLAGQPMMLADFEGSVVLVNVWEEWCGPCRDEIPGLARVYSDFRDRGFLILGVNGEPLTPQQIARHSEKLGINYPVVVPDGPMSGTFAGQNVLPYSWLIDRRGRVRAEHAGYLMETSLRTVVERLLNE